MSPLSAVSVQERNDRREERKGVSRPFAQRSFLAPSHQECSPGAICATAQAFRVCHTSRPARASLKKISPRGLGTAGLVVAFARLGRGRKIHCHLEAPPRIQAFRAGIMLLRKAGRFLTIWRTSQIKTTLHEFGGNIGFSGFPGTTVTLASASLRRKLRASRSTSSA